jgi:hypothetical protein
MELVKKTDAILGQLEEILSLSNPDTENLKKQIDIIENEELLKLDDEFDDWRGQISDQGNSNEETDKLIDKIGDKFIEADTLINSICEKFGLEEEYDDGDDGFLDPLDDDDDDDDSNDEDEYDIVLDEVSRSALKAIGLDNEDEQSINLMGAILIGISSEESDEAIAGRAFAQLAMSGFMLPMEDIKDMCRKTRENCKKQLFGLQIAFNSLREYNCSALDALSQIEMFL